jgi:magnesium chelatase subunit I
VLRWILQTRSTRINMVDLPLGATEDRVCGTIDIEKALTEGVKAFEPGLLVGCRCSAWCRSAP